MGCAWEGLLAVVYFAVGPASLKKAALSAASARKHGGARVRTMVVTDDAGASRLRRGEYAFDTVESVGRAKGPSVEFSATRPLGSTSTLSTSERWRNRTDPANVALRALRAAKIDALERALKRYDRAVFLDADTYVCKPIVEDLGCAVEPPTAVAFVPVAAGKEHAASILAASARWRVPRTVREANTGVVAARNDSTTRALVRAWRRAYEDLAQQSGFLMDQPAFRAALHATGAPHAHLPPEFNCRGHDRHAAQTAVALRCRGFRHLKGPVQTRLRGGRGCAVLHSHDLREPS
mmetsp:Transcript_8301/g.29189  ORF Transcript_8301/g.29189 Transcript_8301/m.29189 type:complete len:293 (-) Transcript_8301:16-894(-)